MTENTRVEKNLTRRLFGLLGLSAAGTGLVACQADTGGGDGEGGGDPGTNNPDGVFHGAWPYEAPPTGHFNYAPGVIGGIILGPGLWHHMVLAPGGLWDWSAEEWLYLLAEGFEFTENRFVYTLKPDLKWSDGSDLTAADVESTFWLRWLMNQQEWTMVSGLEATGDLEVTFELNDPSTVVERRIMKAPILPAAVYGEFGEKAKALQEDGQETDSDEANSLRDEVQEWRPEDNETEVLFSGPFAIDFGSVSDASITLPKNEHGLLADQVAFESLVVYNGETDDITPLVLDGTIDYATHGFPVSTQQEWEAQGVETKLSGTYSGMSLLLSMGRHEEFKDPLFRQALACAIDKESAGTISLDKSVQIPDMSGMPQLLSEQWLDDGTRSELDAYDFDDSRAASLLEEAGWTFSNGTWATPSGDAASYSITFQSDFADYPPSAQFIAEQLTEFGITIELDGIESPNMTERVHTGNFDIVTFSWGGGETHPHYAYSSAFITENEPISRNQGGRGMDYDLVREIEGMGEVDIQRLVTESGEGLDEDRQRELINRLALIFNSELPKVPVWERLGNNPAQAGPRVLSFPGDDDPIWASGSYSDNPVVQAMYKGDVMPS
ncbi:ABC transporter substrate-binding protein [Brachybacterium sp. AOP43-C2-M15]|uniref:ABC transporter substrate-binding protein n=1 Tax=Brachybacterium sp. AOP43-C2-M15 TaxID=3457661 RepID=UPI0040339D0F